MFLSSALSLLILSIRVYYIREVFTPSDLVNHCCGCCIVQSILMRGSMTSLLKLCQQELVETILNQNMNVWIVVFLSGKPLVAFLYEQFFSYFVTVNLIYVAIIAIVGRRQAGTISLGSLFSSLLNNFSYHCYLNTRNGNSQICNNNNNTL